MEDDYRNDNKIGIVVRKGDEDRVKEITELANELGATEINVVKSRKWLIDLAFKTKKEKDAFFDELYAVCPYDSHMITRKIK